MRRNRTLGSASKAHALSSAGIRCANARPGSGAEYAESVGGTIRVVANVVEKKETSKPDRGVVSFQRQCVNQRGEVVQEMKATLMFKRRPNG